MCIKLLASLCQKLQLDENISKEKQMTLQGHYCSLITLGFVCVSPPTRVSLLLCVWVCARVCEGSNYANDGWRPSEAQCRYEHPVSHMRLCIYSRTHFIPPNDPWPCSCTTLSVLERQVQRTDDKRPNNDCHCGHSCFILSVYGEDPEPRV